MVGVTALTIHGAGIVVESLLIFCLDMYSDYITVM